MISWHHFTSEPPWPIPGEGEPLAVAVRLGREYPAHWEKSNRPEVVAHLEGLLATVAAIHPVEIERDPQGVLGQPRSQFWDDRSGEAA